jgi:Homing endonuclease associated repeat
MSIPDQDAVLNAIRKCAATIGRPPSRSEFMASAAMTEYQVLRHFPSWREAVRAAGLEPHSINQPLAVETLLEDWGEVVRRMRQIPTRVQYRKAGNYSLGVFDKRIGSWTAVPPRFREWASESPAWADVVALLPLENGRPEQQAVPTLEEPLLPTLKPIHRKLSSGPTYGNPLDFRGLRHEPINENGVVFLFGMVARELRRFKRGCRIVKPSDRSDQGSGNGFELNSNSRAETSEITVIPWMVATLSSAGGTTGPSVPLAWRYSN